MNVQMNIAFKIQTITTVPIAAGSLKLFLPIQNLPVFF